MTDVQLDANKLDVYAPEVAALLDVLALRKLAEQTAIASGRRLAIRVVQMLTRLDQRLAGR